MQLTKLIAILFNEKRWNLIGHAHMAAISIVLKAKWVHFQTNNRNKGNILHCSLAINLLYLSFSIPQNWHYCWASCVSCLEIPVWFFWKRKNETKKRKELIWHSDMYWLTSFFEDGHTVRLLYYDSAHPHVLTSAFCTSASCKCQQFYASGYFPIRGRVIQMRDDRPSLPAPPVHPCIPASHHHMFKAWLGGFIRHSD